MQGAAAGRDPEGRKRDKRANLRIECEEIVDKFERWQTWEFQRKIMDGLTG